MTKKSNRTKTSAGSGRAAGRRLAPARLIALQDERDALLISIADLEREQAAGDLDELDFSRLHDDYTTRTASVLRAIESGQESQGGDVEASVSRRLIGALLVGFFAIVVGLFLARTLGERGVDEALSGSIDTSRRDQVINCRRLGEDGDLVAALECYDEVIELDPTNAEALTYRGWFRILQVDAVTQAGEPEVAQQLLVTGQRDLNLAIEIDPTVPDAFAFRSVLHSRLGRSEAACADIASLRELDPPQFYLSQTAQIAATNGCEGG